ncbi:protein PLASTID MOVEMENT IMPAIRED 1-RELATED 1-like [Durio zibethinus]|uniref:Protein PLASTID MOVEMENT IMPAIRED 1-RELATED 1-like n=1 Tax=Durio zibethinus TaxID=66656 RepID=A0A6P5XWY9_DURZI|nr:protein PLASTID MOVEMENT IMPAIRED 1-RELATED 1-like [Durio zibethinus]XP_022732723.1 protein PLASTID MOVEMENT IMPAIRED 1-RELATED 1-like [Durio zibethinus]
MMLSKVEARKKNGEDSGNGKLLNEIEAINKALYLDKNASRTSFSAFNSRSNPAGKTHLPEPKLKHKNGNEDPSCKEKKSIWNWKPLKAFSNVRNRRFDCCFSLQVHSIEGLPASFKDLSLCVHWKRRDGGLITHPAKVFDGTAEFEEKLTHTCSVYGSRSGPHHSAKYEAKHFLFYASVFGAPDVDLGRHRVDLTRLLPLTLEELEEEKSSGKWTTSFKLSGKAKGATINVSFGYMVIGDNPNAPGDNQYGSELSHMKQNNLNMGKAATEFGHGDQTGTMRRVESLPSLDNLRSFGSSHLVEEIKDLHEVLPLSKSELDDTNMLDQKLDEDKSDASAASKPEPDVLTEQFEAITPPSYFVSESSKENIEKETEDNEFSVVEKGIELSSEEQARPEEISIMGAILTVESPQVVETNHCIGVNCEECSQLHPSNEESSSNKRDMLLVQDCNSEEDDQCSKESLMRELELALDGITNLEAALDSPDPENPEDYMENKANYKTNRKAKSLSLDEVTESVASEFLNMIGIDHSPFGLSSESEPESPRERLLRQFEKDTLANGFSLFNFDMADGEELECGLDTSTPSGWANLTDDLPCFIQDGEQEHQMETNVRRKMRAKVLEDLETEALMREWGLNEKAFLRSPSSSSGAFGSPVHLPSEEPLELPPLGEGLGPFLQTKNGGFLRSMNPSLFSNAKSGGSLIMQVSSPVVVPAEMGSGIMDILQQLASVGIEKLSMQANKLMPLEDITGKTMQQVAWEAAPTLEEPDRQCLLQHEFDVGQDRSSGQKKVKRITPLPNSNQCSSTSVNEMGLDYVSLEDLAPLAMHKIEALSMEGLRIQSGMSDEDAPANVSALSIGEFSALQGKGFGISGSLGLEGSAGLQLLDIKDSGDDVDGLMGLSLTLDEWIRLDSGDIDDEDQISERTSKILAAHHATSLDLIRRGSKGEKRRGKKCGLLGNNFTVSLMVQLRDPIRNYEPVGAPMLALIQVERVFVPPKPKIYCTVSSLRNGNQEDDDSESAVTEEVKKEELKEEKASQEEGIPQFRITEVHVAGLKTEPGKKKLWGSTTQQQSASRWLLANGMGKSNKHPLLKSKAASKSSTPSTTKVQPGDTLWSISSRVHGTGVKWKELAALNPHIRNPNVILPNETIRLR